jgi:DNA-binding SARP family transcriptional activator
MSLRLYLAGRTCIDSGRRLVDGFPGVQGRVVFTMLALDHERVLSRDEIAEELWQEVRPRAWDSAVRAIVSKLRGLLDLSGLDGSRALTGAFGYYQFHLPPGTWLDLEAAADAVHRAESFLRTDRAPDACGWALAARAIARRPLLPGAEGPWVTRTRAKLREVNVRALECLAGIWISHGDLSLAVSDAQEAVALEPFRETAHRLLMRAHQAAGNRAEALRAYERCRTLLAEELGVGPASETYALFQELLRSA